MAETTIPKNDAERLDKVYSYVFGNGEPGLDEKIRNLQQKFDKMTDALLWIAKIAGALVFVKAIEVFLSHI